VHPLDLHVSGLALAAQARIDRLAIRSTMPSPIDLTILLLTILLPLAWWFRNSLPIVGGKPRAALTTNGSASRKVDEGDPRDFVGKMERAVSMIAVSRCTRHIAPFALLIVSEQTLCHVLRLPDRYR
jgi:NADPH-ferrihemoprotein reductase